MDPEDSPPAPWPVLPTVAAATASALVAGGAGFVWAARRGLVLARVSCWFCQVGARVRYSQRNCWTCPACGQYNGFDADGDYNRDDPDRRRQWPRGEEPRFAVSASSTGRGSDNNGLCHTCNLNQTLKVEQLARFKPTREASYDREVEAFQEQLERTYRLCQKCEATVHQSLGKQSSWLKPQLLSHRLEKSRLHLDREKRSGRLGKVSWKVNLAPLSPSVDHGRLRALTAAAAAAICSIAFASNSGDLYRDKAILLQWAISSALLLLWSLAWLARPAAARLINFLVLLTFFAVSLASTCQDCSRWLDLLCVVCLASAVVNLVRRTKVPDTRKHKKRSVNQSRVQPRVDDGVENTSCRNQTLPSPVETEKPLAQSVRGDGFVPADNVSIASKASQTSDSALTLKDDDCDVSTLSLEDDDADADVVRRRPSRHHSPAFSIRSYANSPSPVDFGDFRRPPTSLLRPSRFNMSPSRSHMSASPSKRVVKASWVAGGLWQKNTHTDADRESHSRASSQSSGFVSQSGEASFGNNAHYHHQLLLPPPAGNPPSVAPSPAPSLSTVDRLDISGSSRCERASLVSNRLAGNSSFYGPHAGSPSFGQSGLFQSENIQNPSQDLKPLAESSPLQSPSESSIKKSLLDKQINVKLSSLLLTASFVLNVCLCMYLLSKAL